MIWETGGKKWLPRSNVCLAAIGAYPTPVQKCLWTNLKEEYGSWKGIDFESFYEDGHAP